MLCSNMYHPFMIILTILNFWEESTVCESLFYVYGEYLVELVLKLTVKYDFHITSSWPLILDLYDN